eukprot:TRINITY_DN7416_c0_g2_i2.p1 TRINITY_DN7416_c0_g2~~TRINITY_DN7416_c0_g2_i2.p1  ORF type:complete len:634 (+),score=197.57 TRINITY_DN7416_c0_g2_i2:316-2217(+)
MVHTGDNTTGEGDDDDEAIQVFVPKIPKDVYGLALVVTCHNVGHTLGSVDSVQCVVTDMTQNRGAQGVAEPLATIDVKLGKEHSAAIVCCLRRVSLKQRREHARKGRSTKNRRKERERPSNDGSDGSGPLASSSREELSSECSSNGQGSCGDSSSTATKSGGSSLPPDPSSRQGSIQVSVEDENEQRRPVSVEAPMDASVRSSASVTPPSAPLRSRASLWELVEVNRPAHGHTVGERRLLLAMRASLGLSEEVLASEMQMPTTIDVTKRAAVQIRGDVNHVVFAVGWSKVEDDLDSTLIFFDENKEYIDHVNSKNKLISNDKAVVHRGDSVMSSNTKNTAQDKESVDIHIPDIDKNVDCIFLAVSTVERDGRWTNKVSQVQGAYCRLYEIKKNVVGKGKTHNVEDRKELARSNLQKKAKDSIGQIFACLYRDPAEPSGWYVQQLSEPLATLPVACVSPSEFMPITRSLSYFVRSAYKTHSDEWIPSGWVTFRDEMRVRQTLTVTVIQGRNLGPQGPKFKCHVEMWTMDSGKNTVRRRTTATTSRNDPRWDQTFELDVTLLDSVKFVVFDPYFISYCHVPLVSYRSSMEELADKWHPLQGESAHGELRLQITMKPSENQKMNVGLFDDEQCTIL